MHFVIMGCGRVGAALACTLQETGHTVAVIDRNPDAFRRLGTNFTGTMIEGVGFDRDTLKAADVTDAYAFAAVSSGDNSNILAARVARELFEVPNVVARIYDPRRAEAYQRMGIPTVATVRWTADQMLRRMLPAGTAPHFTDPSGRLQLAEVDVNSGWVGHSIAQLEKATGSRVAFVSRLGEGILPSPRTLVQEGDVVFVMMHRADEAKIDTILAKAPEVRS